MIYKLDVKAAAKRFFPHLLQEHAEALIIELARLHNQHEIETVQALTKIHYGKTQTS